MSRTTMRWVGPAAAIRGSGESGPVTVTDREIEGVEPGTDEVVVEVAAGAVARSDLLNSRGVFPGVPAGRVPGRDFAGTVVDGPQRLLGSAVWGTGGGDLGFTRDGSHARYLRLPAAAVVPRPAELDPIEAGAAGLAYLTAQLALTESGPVDAGTTVLILGAGGGVGGAAAGLAKARGAHVIGVVRGAVNAAEARRQGCDSIVDLSSEPLLSSIESAASGRSIDVVVDCVGPPLVNEAVPLIAPGGRLCLFTAPQGGTLHIDVLDFYRRALRLTGVNTLRIDAVAAATVLRSVEPALRSGHLRAPRIAQVLPLRGAHEAYSRLASGTSGGRLVITP